MAAGDTHEVAAALDLLSGAGDACARSRGAGAMTTERANAANVQANNFFIESLR